MPAPRAKAVTVTTAGSKPTRARLCSDCQCFDHLVKAALMTCGLILVHNALVDHAVDNGNSSLVRRRC